MITAVLAVVFAWCLFYGRIPPPPLAVGCLALGAFLVYTGRHMHSDFLSIDVLAQRSRLRSVNPALKLLTLIALMVICVVSNKPATGLFLLAAMLVLAVVFGGLSLHSYIHILALPVSFLLIGGLALLFEVSSVPTGVLSLRVFGVWISVTERSQSYTALIISRALGAVSCLCLLSVTTPMPDIIGVLRRIRCPAVVIDLMYLIYRYIFILMALHHEMRDAAISRLGYRDYRTSLRSIGKIYSNLLARSYRFASRNFDAMESRCYDTGISFLVRRIAIMPAHAAASILLLIVSLCLCILPL